MQQALFNNLINQNLFNSFKNDSSKSPQFIVIQFQLRDLGNPSKQRDDSPIDEQSEDCHLISGAKPSVHTVYGPPCSAAASHREGQEIAVKVAQIEVVDDLDYQEWGTANGETAPGTTSVGNVTRGGMTLNFYGNNTQNFHF